MIWSLRPLLRIGPVPDRPKADRGGSVRVGIVLMAVLRTGPARLDDLSTFTGLPRTAVWRCLHALRQVGWVRIRRGDGSYQVTQACVASVLGTTRPE